MYVWGTGTHGELGLGDVVEAHIPTMLFCEEKVRKVACGSYHSAFLTETTYQVYVFGSGEYGGLGLGDATSKFVPTALLVCQERVRDVYCGTYHTIFLTQSFESRGSYADSSVYACGLPGNSFTPQLTIVLMLEKNRHEKIKSVSCGCNSVAFMVNL